MEENWYAVEEQIRDRLSDARVAARIRTLTREPAPTYFLYLESLGFGGRSAAQP